MSRSKRFCFTWFNYDEKSIEKLQNVEQIVYGICGKEIAPKTGTPHLQGYIELNRRYTIKSLQKVLKSHCIGVAIFVCKGSQKQNQDYCSKDGNAIEWGECMKQGKRNDIEYMKELIDEGADNIELWNECPKTYARYYKFVKHIRNELRNRKTMNELQEKMSKVTLRKWQEDALEHLDAQNERKVTWVVDRVGGKGKTFLAKKLSTEGAFYVNGGKASDIAYAYNYEKTVVFDLTRQQSEFVNYNTIESFKNGMLFSPKYDSQMKVFPSCKVIVFSNYMPELNKLSADRWDIMDLNERVEENYEEFFV